MTQVSGDSFNDGPYFKENKQKNTRRPILITMICVYLILKFLGGIPLLIKYGFMIMFRDVQMPIFLTSFAGVLCVYGIWQMKKWGIQLYVVLTAANQLLLFNIGAWSLTSLIFQAILIGVVFSHYNKMT
ncbi:MAG: hypothetical protein CL824_03645 [Crocinitomicaceae bacterium]|nr:hypothetical protein [Crocinitomicaceae bacterium]